MISHNIFLLFNNNLYKFVKLVEPERVISYCDIRWGNGNVYTKLGFYFDKITKPNYWYSNNGLDRYHRYNFRKNILVDEGYDVKLTESQIMASKGYYKIWDCGNKKFIWIK